jgi:hypothetical protein
MVNFVGKALWVTEAAMHALPCSGCCPRSPAAQVTMGTSDSVRHHGSVTTVTPQSLRRHSAEAS